jgi:ribosomal protein S27E
VEETNISLDEGLKTVNDTIKLITHTQCPECDTHHSNFEHDLIRDEIVCKGCGLVLSGPPAYVAGREQISYPFENRYCHVIGPFYHYYASYGSLYLSGRSVPDRRHLDYDPMRR